MEFKQGISRNNAQKALELKQRRQMVAHGSCSKFQASDVVYYHWVRDTDPKVVPDGMYYRSRVKIVRYSRYRGCYLYRVDSMGGKWKTTGILETDLALLHEHELPNGAVIGIEDE